MTPEQKAKEYAKWRCGKKELKAEPCLNGFIPMYMEDAYIAGHAEGIKWCVERLRNAPTGEGPTEFYPDVAADWLDSQAGKV